MLSTYNMMLKKEERVEDSNLSTWLSPATVPHRGSTHSYFVLLFFVLSFYEICRAFIEIYKVYTNGIDKILGQQMIA